MTREGKELLLKDLCARIPNHVKVELHGEICTCLGYFDDFVMLTSNTPMGQQTNVANVKPYLRPLSSMTEEEKEELQSLCDGIEIDDDGNHFHYTTIYSDVESFRDIDFNAIDWLNAHHFDYRGLIEKGLALEAPEGMYKID